jgi:hypothetical protein
MTDRVDPPLTHFWTQLLGWPVADCSGLSLFICLAPQAVSMRTPLTSLVPASSAAETERQSANAPQTATAVTRIRRMANLLRVEERV